MTGKETVQVREVGLRDGLQMVRTILTAGQKLLRVGALQGGRKDERGVLRRRARCGVIRESYPNIEANILKSWFNIVPEEEGKFNWRAPYVHRFSKVMRRDGDGRPIDILDMEVEFRAIGDKSVEEVTRGWEVNAVWIDERLGPMPTFSPRWHQVPAV